MSLRGGDVVGLNSNIRIYRYSKGQYFDAHCKWTIVVSIHGRHPDSCITYYVTKELPVKHPCPMRTENMRAEVAVMVGLFDQVRSIQRLVDVLREASVRSKPRSNQYPVALAGLQLSHLHYHP